MNRDPILKDAMQKWGKMSQDTAFRMTYEAREKALLDEAAKFAHAEQQGMEKGIEKGMEKGLKKGKEEGIQEGKTQLSRGMHKNGMDIEDIAKFTNIDVADIRGILEN